MTHRRKESDVTECNPPTRLETFLTAVKLHLRLSHVKLQQFWYYADRPTKMSIAKRFMRTKQILILITSFLFVAGTIWFGSHPDVSPVVIKEHHFIFVLPTVPTVAFPDHSSLVRRLGLEDGLLDINQTLEEGSMQIFKHVQWELEMPQFANKEGKAIVTAIFEKSDYEKCLKLISSVQLFAGNVHLAIFDLIPPDKKEKPKKHRDLYREQFYTSETVEVYCNMTEVCSIHSPPLLEDWVPKHIRHKEFGAYKAILVQKMLNIFPMVLWLDSEGLIPIFGLDNVWNRTSKYSITAWELSNHCTISAFTFPRLLPYFGFTANDINYVSMIESGSYAFKKTPEVMHLVRKWLNCSLTETCIKPIGCDSRDCPSANCINSRPKYEYLRCHKFETSALSASLVKLGFAHSRAPSMDYPLLKTVQEDSAEVGYNMTSIKARINAQKAKLRRLSSRRSVERPADLI